MNKALKLILWVLTPLVLLTCTFGFLNRTQEYMICALPAPQDFQIDGEQHCENTAYDKARDSYISSLGIYVLRIPSLDVFSKDSIENVIKDVEKM